MPRYAAVDIGSNSVRMQAAEVAPGSPADELIADREVTRLGESVFRSGRISDEAMTNVCQVLKRMADAYKRLDVMGARAVATSAVRDASNQGEFVLRASEALGTPVEIISGAEEARLIYLGVQSRWPHSEGRVLIIDVGGGSAEFIVGESGEMKEGVSRPLGAVRLTEVFLKEDPPTPIALHRMNRFIDDKFDPVKRRIGDAPFDHVIGTSSTAAVIVSAINRVPRAKRDEADQKWAKTTDVRKLYAQLSSMDIGERKKTEGIGPRRAEIVIAGAAVFLRALETLNLPGLHYSAAGVRDGIIADLAARGVGRERSRLPRPQVRVVESMCRKYNVEMRNAKQVAGFASQLFESLLPLHSLSHETGRLLEAAALLHNTGHYISGTGHHKHSSYIVGNSDMPGFTDRERHLIALLCRYHRKSLPGPRHDVFRALPADEKRVVQLLTPLLRIAVALDAGHSQKIKEIDTTVANNGVTVSIRAEDDTDLEIWAVERVADSFRQMYGMALAITKTKG